MHQKELELCQQQINEQCSEDPLKFWDKEKYFVNLPTTTTDINPTKASHPGMNLEDTELCRQEIEDLLSRGMIEKSNSPWAC